MLTTTFTAARDLVASSAIDVAVIDFATAREVDLVIDAARSRRVPIIALTRDASPAKFACLCADPRLDHVIAVGAEPGDGSLMGSADRHELLVTIEKLLRRDLFGIEKYVTEFGIDATVVALGGLADLPRLLQDLNTALGLVGVGRRLYRRAEVVVQELVKNAFSHAGTAVSVTYVCDGDRFVVGVTDGAGLLSPAAIRRVFANAAHTPTGLFHAMVMSSQLIFDIEPGHRTEVISVITLGDLGGQGHRHAMHLFVSPRRDGVPDLLETPLGSDRVMLSESLRIDLRSELGAARFPGPLPRPVMRPPMRRAATQRGEEERADAHWFEPVGLDTVKGLLRGSARIETAVAAALRYLASEFDAAVALEIVDGRLVPWLAIGRIADWAKLGSVALPLEAPGQLTQAALHRRARRLAPRRYATDAGFTRFVAGHARADSLAAPVLLAATPRMVLVAVGAAAKADASAEILDSVRNELEAALARVADQHGKGGERPRAEAVVVKPRADTSEPTLVRTYESAPVGIEAELDAQALGAPELDGILRAPVFVAAEDSLPYLQVTVADIHRAVTVDGGVVEAAAVPAESAPYSMLEIGPPSRVGGGAEPADGVVVARAPRLESAPYSAMEIGRDFSAERGASPSGAVLAEAAGMESAPYALVEVATPGDPNVPLELPPDFSEPYLQFRVRQPSPAASVEDAVRSVLGRGRSPLPD